MRGLAGGNWVPCGVCRDQERLGWADVLKMHGYVIVKLRAKEKLAAVGQLQRQVSAPQQLHKFMRLDWGHDGFFFQTASNDKDFVSYCGPQETSMPEALMTVLTLPRRRCYADVDPAISMKRLIQAIDEVKDNSYDLATWNCNHFANLVVQILTGSRQEQKTPSAMALEAMALRWWPGVQGTCCAKQVQEDPMGPMPLRVREDPMAPVPSRVREAPMGPVPLRH